MTREEFSGNFRKAAERSHELALMTVENELRPPFSFLVKLNQSYDGNKLAKGEIIFPEIRAKESDPVGPLIHDEVIGLLWRESFVPEWVDITPWEATNEGMKFQLRCCGRFTDGKPHLYHEAEGYPPFHSPGVWRPPDWESMEKSGRFDLNWHLAHRRVGSTIV